MTLYLSHVRLSRSPSAQALAHVLQPESAPKRRAVSHNLIWSLFADGPDRRRDFLWREEKEGSFLVLSSREPIQTDLFQPHAIKPFAPKLTAGDELAFSLRVNATRMKRDTKNHVDVVMDALRAVPVDQRASQRLPLAQTASAAWLQGQGEKHGFALIASQCEDYSAQPLEGYRGARKGQPQFGICDITGKLRVVEPSVFINQLASGFGRAKAFGCGLMLIRRIQ